MISDHFSEEELVVTTVEYHNGARDLKSAFAP